jgi:DNA-binding transcriptional LysR family regulator
VYELKSFSKAGESMFLSQPTISAHIHTLEKDLNVRLFDRLGRVVLPTSAGDILYRYVKQAFSSIEAAKAEIQLLQECVSGVLDVGGSTIPAHYLLPTILAGFTKMYPDVTMHLRVGDSSAIIRMVEQGELMVGVVGAQDEGSDLVYQQLFTDNLVIIAAPSLLQRKDKLGLDEVLSLPWIMREQGSGTRKSLERSLTRIGADLRNLKTVVTVESTLGVLQCVKAGLGVSVTSRLAASSYLDRGELVEIDAPSLMLERSFYCVSQERRFVFPAVRHFSEYLQKQCSKISF